jgi:DNA polymerase-3 subunit delta'
MTKLLLHQDTAASINSYLARPTHALIIDGKVGSGKRTTAEYLATGILGLNEGLLESFPQLLTIEPKNSSISINEIRQAQQFLKLKTTGQASLRRILIVDKAEQMTIEAQNAFLKILEEPPADTVILILTSQKIKLLPTIRSRAQRLTIKPVSKILLDDYFAGQGYTQTSIEQAHHLTGSRIGLMSSILKDEASSQLDYIDQAKRVLAMTRFERLATTDDISKNKEAIPGLIDGLIIVSQAALEQTLKKDNIPQAKKWHNTLQLATEVEQQLPTNPNSKLLMTNLFLNL